MSLFIFIYRSHPERFVYVLCFYWYTPLKFELHRCSLALEFRRIIQTMKRTFFSGNKVELSLVMNSLTMIGKLLNMCEEALGPYYQNLAVQYFPRTDRANEEYLLYA